MTREEAIRRIEFCRNFLANNYPDMGEPNITAFNMAIETLGQKPCKEQEIYEKAYKEGYDKGWNDGNFISKNRWIPIKTRPLTEVDQLPDDAQEVLITNKYGDVYIDTFYKDGGGYFEWRNWVVDDIKAWMPLPEPYKAESEE